MSVLDTSININYFFEVITQIPHGSYHEDKLADYLVMFAENNDLQYQRDDLHNVVIFKDASKGYEDKDSLILQAHIDMVCEKDKGYEHDFENDPLKLYIEDGWLHATHTTLGADNGAGAAYMLAILDDNTLNHPALECVFTVQEEVGLCGAQYLDTSNLKATRMINLDSESEGSICISSSGVIDETVSKEYTYKENTKPAYTIEVTGLLGGHSGGEIHKFRGNSNKILARVLYACLPLGIELVTISGGSKKNAIPRDAQATIVSDNKDIMSCVEKVAQEIKEELKDNDPNLQITIAETTSNVCMDAQTTTDIVNYLFLSINGCLELSQELEDLPLCSLNLGVVETLEDKVMAYYHIRSPQKSKRANVCAQLEGVAALCNCKGEHRGDHDGWTSEKDSKIRSAFKALYKERTGVDLTEFATHGGLETGTFKGKMPQLDIITIGPNMKDVHSPKERLNLDSFMKTYDLLVEFISRL